MLYGETAPLASRASAVPAPVAAPYPIWYDVPVPERPLRRLRTAFRAILLIPSAIVLGFFTWLAYLIAGAAWFIILFSGRYDRTLWNLTASYLERRARFLTSAALLRDELPPLGGGEYPTVFVMEHPPRQSRAKAFFRYVLSLPIYLTLSLAVYPWTACTVIAWAAILCTGRYPEGIRRLMVGLNRWFLRAEAYTLLMRDDYPPFSLGLHERAPQAARGWGTAPTAPFGVAYGPTQPAAGYWTPGTGFPAGPAVAASPIAPEFPLAPASPVSDEEADHDSGFFARPLRPEE